MTMFGAFTHVSIIIVSCLPSHLSLIAWLIVYFGFLFKYNFSPKLLSRGITKKPIVLKSVKYTFGVLQDGTDENETTLFDYKVPTVYITNLFFTIIFICFSAIGLFWLKFLIQEVSTSDFASSGVICYFNFSTLCSETDLCSTVDDVLVCYKFVFDFGDALEGSVGLLAFYLTSHALGTVLLLGLSEGKNGSAKRMCCTAVIHVCIIVFTLVVTAIIGVIAAYSIRNGRIYESSLQVYYVLQLFIGLINAFAIPWWKFKKLK